MWPGQLVMEGKWLGHSPEPYPWEADHVYVSCVLGWPVLRSSSFRGGGPFRAQPLGLLCQACEDKCSTEKEERTEGGACPASQAHLPGPEVILSRAIHSS